MELSRYTPQAVDALSKAQAAAKEYGHSFVGSEHLLMGIIKCGDKTAFSLTNHGVTAEDVAPYIDTVIGRGRSIFTDSFGNTHTVKRILELSLYEAKSAGSDLVGTEHILLSIMRERDSMGSRIIDSLCNNKESLKQALLNAVSSDEDRGTERDDVLPDTADNTDSRFYFGSFAHGRSSTPILDEYTKDLTEAAREGMLDPVIGRDDVIKKVMQTLCRRMKNDPVLIGEPGVGKSAIVEGLASLISEGSVPPRLKGSRVLSLDLAGMIAGTKYRGEFEERLKAAIEELNPGIILFIDEIHNIVGAGAGEGSMDAANILKPALARGELHAIGATTIAEYRHYIESDPALERRFTPILVNEPSMEETKKILLGLKDRYEKHHGITIEMSAIDAAAELSVRFITDRYLPDKAIDLIDEACSKARLESPENESITDRDISKVIGERIGVDPSDYYGSQRFSVLEDNLKTVVFGQDNALERIVSVLKKSAAGLNESGRPFASFIFAGPSGVGKKHAVSSLAAASFGGSLLKLSGIDLKNDVLLSRIKGAHAGAGGLSSGKSASEFVREKPFSVIALIDAEDASYDALMAFEEIVKSGVILDGKARSVSFRNAVIVLCVDTDDAKNTVGFKDAENEGTVVKAVREMLPSSLVSSVDDIIVFERPDDSASCRIVVSLLDGISGRLRNKGIEFKYGETVVSHIVSSSKGSSKLASKLISKSIEDRLSDMILNKEIDLGDCVLAVCFGDKIIIQKGDIQYDHS